MNRPIVSDGFLNGLKWWPVVFFLALCCTVFGAEPGEIRLPASVTPVTPSAVTSLSVDAIFVIECDTPCMVLSSREGYVTIEEQPGPLRIRGRFADGTKVETRTYKAKQLWIVEAATAGEVELLIVPDGVKDASKVIRRTLVVGGVGPQPPPTPIPPTPAPVPPTPTPDPIPQPLGLVAAVANSVRLHVPAGERAFAEKLAENYRVGATKIARGEWPPDLRGVSLKQRELNDTIPGFKRDVWIDVLRDVATVLGEAHNAGKLNDPKKIAAAWAELSLAFSEVAKAAK